MKWREIDQHWKQFEGVVKDRWQELTNKQLNRINGNKESLNLELQKLYKQTQEEANKSIDDFLGSFDGILRGESSVIKPDEKTSSDLTDQHEPMSSDLTDQNEQTSSDPTNQSESI